jgi:phosphoribosylformimino-5-aminoimidazole carboxamide ribotide isomerase
VSRQPRLIPVLDVIGGVVVHAVGGRRDEYRPVVSRLTDSADPVEVGRKLLEATGGSELYLADLDAIRGRPADPAGLVERLAKSLNALVWADVGIRSINDHGRLPHPIRSMAVVGFETIEGPDQLGYAAAHFAPDLAFSIDLQRGRLFGNWRAWRHEGVSWPDDVIGLADAALRIGWQPALIVIDLSRVGERRGPGTELICRRIKERWPEVELIAGGGVRNWDDVRRFEDTGVDAVLVASALHDGTLFGPGSTSSASSAG